MFKFQHWIANKTSLFGTTGIFQPSGSNMYQRNKCRVSPPGLTSPARSSQTLAPIIQYCQNIRSIKTIEVPIQLPILHQKTNNAFVFFQPTNTIFSEQTGAFPIISNRKYCYIMFVYVYDINTILMRCLKTKAGVEHLQTFKDVHNLLLHRGLQPKYCRMDNECSAPIKKFITDNKMELQLTPRKYTKETGLNGPYRLAKPTS